MILKDNPNINETPSASAACISNRPILTRRDLFQGLLGAALTATLTGSCSQSEKKKEQIPTTQPSAETAAEKPVTIPDIYISQERFSPPRPDGLEALTDEEFLAICKELAKVATAHIAELANSPRNESNLRAQYMREFFIALTEKLRRSSPLIDKSLTAALKKAERNPEKYAYYLNKYLIPAGIYLYYHAAGTNSKMMLYTIEKAHITEVDDGKGPVKIPTLHLTSTSGHVKDSSLGTADGDFTYTLIFPQKIRKLVKELIKKSPPYARFQVKSEDEDQIYEQFLRDVIRHESTHNFIAVKYPQAGKTTDRQTYYQVELKGDIPGGNYVEFNGAYPPVTFQELCGVGMHLARTELEVPYLQLEKCRDEDKMSPVYNLVGKMMPFVTLQTAPDTPLRQKIIERLKQGRLEYKPLHELMGTPPYSIEHTRQAGEQLYRLGCKLLQQAEKGELKKVRLQKVKQQTQKGHLQ